jgi:hypothetical protein
LQLALFLSVQSNHKLKDRRATGTDKQINSCYARLLKEQISVDSRPLDEQSASIGIHPLIMEYGNRKSHRFMISQQLLIIVRLGFTLQSISNQYEGWKSHSPILYLLLRGFADFSGDLRQGMFSCTKPVQQLGENGARHITLSLHCH